ncbi:hypothetical protein [Gracilimonas mengyeensis]|uniref:DinB superfamily protein n=1 Tax=Gracilimonas mengyeensis TaxID=1302730 RepID=A0A521AQS5_9BACT|nr:hypothetical protein [Gracilimonas mengyeensis]SMO37162.1 hypothetical protein SAMN06265219_101317 [Gracilimonas mengyeensis]
MDIKQSQIDSLIDDVAYLEHEAEALKYVIESVPYDESPEGGRSISEILLYLDHAQQNYYRRVIEDAFKSVRPINLNAYSRPEDTFEVDEDLLKDIQKLLYKISKHRVALLNLIKNIQLIDWEREISRGKETLTLYEFVNQMVRKERSTLKEIADLVMAYQNSKQVQREMQSRNPDQ